jgi:hypothetical protein
MIPSINELIPVLQMAISPVILISGVGLLLLSMTNRLGRTIDRARLLSAQIDTVSGDTRDQLSNQIVILWKRARIIRRGILLAILSALSSALLIIFLFLMALLRADTGWPLILLFVACIASLIGALITFILDIDLSLSALKLEINRDD